ncbi:MAG: hypothetical protein KBB64_10765, partial [Bacteroidia bacterium]|nr:hypothetical protein [Bacteroidia bacterium]
MRKIYTLLVIFLFSLVSADTIAQCTGGTSGGGITPTAAWSSTNTLNIAGNSYRTFAATAGATYYFSFCAADGGSST